MKTMFLVLTGLALAGSAPAIAAENVQASSQTESADKQSPAVQSEVQSEAATRVADWIAASGDNQSLPYIIIDKKTASLTLYDAEGMPLAHGPVLIGKALGDEASPGVGNKKLAEIGPAEKTTPAGRFLAKYGPAAGKEKVLWVDYGDSVALHPIPPGVSPKERRRQRMLSPTSEDNRITFGCINVPTAIYTQVRPLFLKGGGYVYVLPDEKALEDVFPRLHVQPRAVVAEKAAPLVAEQAVAEQATDQASSLSANQVMGPPAP